MRPGNLVWIACQSSELEALATDHLCDLFADEGLLIEHSARTLLHRADRSRLVCQLHRHRHLGRRVLLVRRLDRLRASQQARLCLWLSSGRSGADWIVATGRLPYLDADRRRFEERVSLRFQPGLEVGFDSARRETCMASGDACVEI